ncbi:sensor domain-containing diguanylate cyclase [Frankia tisae]|uniref:sensor domain-containing diguanylate cyclase n=2 Tax=Frankia tisae TaxID=2950104 RepID=UPI0021C01F48|nr:GGDEF domain-containing protein [Frankia tisae]
MSSNDEVGFTGRFRPTTAADENEEGHPPMPLRLRLPCRPGCALLSGARRAWQRLRVRDSRARPRPPAACPPALRMAGLGLPGASGSGDDRRPVDRAHHGRAGGDGSPRRRHRVLPRLVGRDWTLWCAPRAVVRRVVGVMLCWAVLVGVAIAGLRPRWVDVLAFAAFVALGGCAVVVSGRLGADLAVFPAARHDLLATWTVAVAVLLPPLYPTVIGLPLCWLAGRADPVRPPHLRMFHAAALGIAGFCASSVHLLLSPTRGPFTVDGLVGSGSAAAAFLSAVAVYPLVASLPGVGMARAGRGDGLDAWLGGAPPGTDVHRPAGPPSRASRLGREPVPARAVEICSAIVVAVLWAASPFLMLAVTPPVLLLQRSLLHADLLHAARSDAKTRLANAAYWRQVAEREINRAARAGRPLSVLLVDIDHFKRVNDRFGHLIGDVILLAVADTLRAAARPRDLVGRFGGEEFVILLTEVGREHAADIAERIRRQVAATRCRLDGRPPLSVTVSVGVATHHGTAGDLSALIARADTALYRAKADGRNRVHLADPLCTPA